MNHVVNGFLRKHKTSVWYKYLIQRLSSKEDIVNVGKENERKENIASDEQEIVYPFDCE